MATRRFPSNNKNSSSNLHSLKEKITCGVCNKQYVKPKTLPCLHSYCLSCLASLQLSDLAQKKLVCPECDKTIVIESDSLNAFPDAFIINRQISEFVFLQKVHGVVDSNCEKCTGKSVKSTTFCDGCGKFVCDLCVTIHRSWSEFSDHKLLKLSDLKECYLKYIPDAVTLANCIQHDKECTAYCETCMKEVCHECILRSHKEHQCNLTADSAKNHKSSTKEKLLMIDTVPDELDAAISKLQELSLKFVQDGNAVKAEIDEKFKEIEVTVAKRQKALIAEAMTTVDEKTRLLDDQRKDLVHVKNKVTSCKSFVIQTIESDHNSEFLILKKQMCDRIAEVSKEFSATELTPIEQPSIKFSLDSTLRSKLKKCGSTSDGSILHVGYSSLANNNCISTNIWPSQFIINEVVTFYISLSTSYFSIRSNPAEQIAAKIHCIRDNSICPATVTISNSGFAKIQCSFAERGRYVFIVEISGQHINGSPHPFFVKPTSTQFHAPVRSINKLVTPKGLAVNKKNQIIISQEDLHNVTVFGRRCRKVLTFGSSGSGEAQFNRPNGVATDSKNSIFISDSRNNRIQKFDGDGNFIKEFNGEDDACGVLKQPTGIHVSRYDEVYVVDRGNGRIVILTADLAYKYSFGSMGKNKGQFEDPWDISMDSNGLVYVTDTKMHTIQIFNPSGEYRGQIGMQGTQKSRLSRPSGIAIDQFGRIFVCEFGNHRVSIFHISSEFVDCFSTGLSMVNPHSIALDEDGFIYVSSAEAVHVF